MNPLLLALPGSLAIPVLAAVFGGILVALHKTSSGSGSSSAGSLSTPQELSLANALATQNSNAQTQSVINNFNPQALIASDLNSKTFQSQINSIVNTSTASLQKEISGLSNVVSQIPKQQTVIVNTPAPPGPSGGFFSFLGL